MGRSITEFVQDAIKAGLPEKQAKFIAAWQTSKSVTEVVEATGLTENSVAAMASELRNPEYVTTVKTDTGKPDGNPFYKTAAKDANGKRGETLSQDDAQQNKQGKFVKVLVPVLTDELDDKGNRKPQVKRDAIPLKSFTRVRKVNGAAIVAAAKTLCANLDAHGIDCGDEGDENAE